MQEAEADKDLNPRDYPSWWKRILIGAVIGGLYGALSIWWYEFSLVRLLAAILAGASFFAIFGLVAVVFAQHRLKVLAAAGFAGLVAGGVYWIVARPSSSPLLAIGIGLISGIVNVWVESKGTHDKHSP